MVPLPATLKIKDFDGIISHTTEVEGEKIMFIKRMNWEKEWNKIKKSIKNLVLYQGIKQPLTVKLGEIYIGLLNETYERIFIIRQTSPSVFMAYLIDLGKLYEVNIDKLYDAPSKLLKGGIHNCFCAVQVSPTERSSVYNMLRGVKCRCLVNGISISQTVIALIHGWLLVEHEGRFIDMLEYQQKKFKQRQMNRLFIQTVFKQYEPEIIPISMKVVYNKKDRMTNTFWVVNKKNFDLVEKALKCNTGRLMQFPRLAPASDSQLQCTPCVVRTHLNCSNGTLFRGVPAHYDLNTKRCSVFLVDFGWFNWNDMHNIMNISSMEKKNPIMNLPVSLIRCRENSTSPLKLQDLVVGKDYEICIRNLPEGDIYGVDLMNPFEITCITNSRAHRIVYNSSITAEAGSIDVGQKLIKNEVVEHQENVNEPNNSSRDFAHQKSHQWGPIGDLEPIPNTNIQDAPASDPENNVAEINDDDKFTETIMKNQTVNRNFGSFHTISFIHQYLLIILMTVQRILLIIWMYMRRRIGNKK